MHWNMNFAEYLHSKASSSARFQLFGGINVLLRFSSGSLCYNNLRRRTLYSVAQTILCRLFLVLSFYSTFAYRGQAYRLLY